MPTRDPESENRELRARIAALIEEAGHNERLLTRNQERDRLKHEALGAMGWRTGVVWECAVRHVLDETVDELETWIRTPDAASLDISWEQA